MSTCWTQEAIARPPHLDLRPGDRARRSIDGTLTFIARGNGSLLRKLCLEPLV